MSIDAMKQALEALESYEYYIHPLTDYFGGPKVPRELSTSAQVEDAITALRLAIEQAEKQEPVACQYAVDVAMPEYRCVGKCQYTAPPQQEKQKPVAWANINKHGDITHTSNKQTAWAKTPLYAAPPQRQPLTEETLYAMAEVAWRAGWAACRDAEFVGEEAEDEMWGEQGANVMQNIKVKHGIGGNHG